MTTTKRTYGEHYRRARKRAELTQVEVSEALGIDQRLLSKYETDVATPSIATLERMAQLYDVTLDELTGRDVADPPVTVRYLFPAELTPSLEAAA